MSRSNESAKVLLKYETAVNGFVFCKWMVVGGIFLLLPAGMIGGLVGGLANSPTIFMAASGTIWVLGLVALIAKSVHNIKNSESCILEDGLFTKVGKKERLVPFSDIGHVGQPDDRTIEVYTPLQKTEARDIITIELPKREADRCFEKTVAILKESSAHPFSVMQGDELAHSQEITGLWESDEAVISSIRLAPHGVSPSIRQVHFNGAEEPQFYIVKARKPANRMDLFAIPDWVGPTTDIKEDTLVLLCLSLSRRRGSMISYKIMTERSMVVGHYGWKRTSASTRRHFLDVLGETVQWKGNRLLGFEFSNEGQQIGNVGRCLNEVSVNFNCRFKVSTGLAIAAAMSLDWIERR